MQSDSKQHMKQVRTVSVDLECSKENKKDNFEWKRKALGGGGGGGGGGQKRGRGLSIITNIIDFFKLTTCVPCMKNSIY